MAMVRIMIEALEIMKAFLFIITFVLTLLILPAYADPTVNIVSGPKTLFGFPACSGRPDDSVTLLVHDKGKVVTRHHFCSSNGVAAAKIEKDLIGNIFILVEYGTGHGTADAFSGYLIIFELPKYSFGKVNALYEYLRTPLSGSAGPYSRWVYHYRTEKPKCGGLRLLFTRAMEGAETNIVSAPAQKMRVIQVGGTPSCQG